MKLSFILAIASTDNVLSTQLELQLPIASMYHVLLAGLTESLLDASGRMRAHLVLNHVDNLDLPQYCLQRYDLYVLG